MLLWFFAGFIVYVAIFLVIIFELMLSAYLCFKSGWFDSLDTGIIVEFSSGIADTSDALGAMTNSSAAWMGAASEDETVYYQIAAVISIAFTVLSIILVFLWKTQVSTLTPTLTLTLTLPLTLTLTLPLTLTVALPLTLTLTLRRSSAASPSSRRWQRSSARSPCS